MSLFISLLGPFYVSRCSSVSNFTRTFCYLHSFKCFTSRLPRIFLLLHFVKVEMMPLCLSVRIIFLSNCEWKFESTRCHTVVIRTELMLFQCYEYHILCSYYYVPKKTRHTKFIVLLSILHKLNIFRFTSFSICIVHISINLFFFQIHSIHFDKFMFLKSNMLNECTGIDIDWIWFCYTNWSVLQLSYRVVSINLFLLFLQIYTHVFWLV